MLFVGVVPGLLGLRGCAVEDSKEVDLRWLLERCLSTLGYVCGEFFHFANSKTSSPLPSSASPKVTLCKKASSQMVSVYYFFNYCFVGPMLGGSLPCFFWGRGYRLHLFAYPFLAGSGMKVEPTSRFPLSIQLPRFLHVWHLKSWWLFVVTGGCLKVRAYIFPPALWCAEMCVRLPRCLI